jgi:amidophosphoribosyltransferase
MNNLVERLYKFGVVEVHIRIASPPITNTCEYGIDIPTKNELIFKNSRQIQDEIKCNSIKYLNLEDNLNMFKNPNDKCTKCLYQKPIYDW